MVSVSEQDLVTISVRLMEIAEYVRGGGGDEGTRLAAVNALRACSNSCDARYLGQLVSGLVTACEALAGLQATV
jgi:hypothetical protein